MSLLSLRGPCHPPRPDALTMRGMVRRSGRPARCVTRSIVCVALRCASARAARVASHKESNKDAEVARRRRGTTQCNFFTITSFAFSVELTDSVTVYTRAESRLSTHAIGKPKRDVYCSTCAHCHSSGVHSIINSSAADPPELYPTALENLPRFSRSSGRSPAACCPRTHDRMAPHGSDAF